MYGVAQSGAVLRARLETCLGCGRAEPHNLHTCHNLHDMRQGGAVEARNLHGVRLIAYMGLVTCLERGRAELSHNLWGSHYFWRPPCKTQGAWAIREPRVIGVWVWGGVRVRERERERER
jgi:hypothetical protein